MNIQSKKGFSKLELLIITLIVCTAAFITVPIYNSYFKTEILKEADQIQNNLPTWNEGYDANSSDVPVRILGKE
jgi:Tfp pilus assembly protein PilE